MLKASENRDFVTNHAVGFKNDGKLVILVSC